MRSKSHQSGFMAILSEHCTIVHCILVSFLVFALFFGCFSCFLTRSSIVQHSTVTVMSSASSSSVTTVYCVTSGCKNRVRPASEGKHFSHQLCREHFKCSPTNTCLRCADFADADWKNINAYFDRLARRAASCKEARKRKQQQQSQELASDSSVHSQPSNPTQSSASASTLASASVSQDTGLMRTGGRKEPPGGLISAA